jgi:CRAL/TRIO domain
MVKISVIGRPHKQASAENIASLRRTLTALEAKHPLLVQYRSHLTDRTLHRFLTCRNSNVEASKDLLLQHLEWRVSYGVDATPVSLADEDFSLFDGLDELYWYGFDRAGHPCLVWRPCKHNSSDTDPESMVRYFCHLLEAGEQQN